MAKRASPSSSRMKKARATSKKKAAAKRTAPAKRLAARKTQGKAAVRGTGRAKTAAPKRAPAKRPTSTRTSPKRAAARPAVARKAAPARRKQAAAKPAVKTKAPPQRFTVSHLREEDFLPNGLRPYARYRDLGIAEATGGLAQAHVIRMIPPVTEEVRQRHLHNVDLQLVYVLKGWMKNEFEGHGVQMMEQGSCWLQPPGIPHTVLDYSDDLEVLEIIIPAEFETLPAD